MEKIIFNNNKEIIVESFGFGMNIIEIIAKIEYIDDLINFASDNFSGKVMILYDADNEYGIVCEHFHHTSFKYNKDNKKYKICIRQTSGGLEATINEIEDHLPWTVSIKDMDKAFEELNRILDSLKNDKEISLSEDNIIVKIWAERVRNNVFKKNDIPHIGNLYNVVSSILNQNKCILDVRDRYGGLKYRVADYIFSIL